MAHQFAPRAIQSNYGDLWQSIASRTGGPGAISLDQARIVHVRWRSLGKLAKAGRL